MAAALSVPLRLSAGWLPSPANRLPIAARSPSPRLQCDESAIPLFTIAHHVDQPQQSEAHHYPFAGADNPKV